MKNVFQFVVGAYRICVSGVKEISITKDECSRTVLKYATNFREPLFTDNMLWRPAFRGNIESGVLVIYLFSSREKTQIFRLPTAFIDRTISGAQDAAEATAEGLELRSEIHFFEHEGESNILCRLEMISDIDWGGRRPSGSCKISSNILEIPFSEWAAIRNTGPRLSDDQEQRLAVDIAESMKNHSVEIIQSYTKRLADLKERAAYVHSEKDEKVFLFWFEKNPGNSTHVAVTSSGRCIIYGDGFGYTRDITYMENHLKEHFWKLRIVHAEKGDVELKSALEKIKDDGEYKRELIEAAE